MNRTQNYQLSQWERTDKIQMEDFNADNAKIDAALAAHAAELAKLPLCGNCRIEYLSYVGTGTYGPDHPTVIHFQKKPLFIMVMGGNECVLASPVILRYICLANTARQEFSTHYATWSDDSFSFYSNSVGDTFNNYDNPKAQMNTNTLPYLAVLFYPQDET